MNLLHVSPPRRRPSPSKPRLSARLWPPSVAREPFCGYGHPLLSTPATEQSEHSHRPAPVVLSLEVDSQTSTDAPPAVTPACVRTIVALASLARRRRNGHVPPTKSECCATSQTARLQFNVEKVCAHHAASTPEQLTPSHETVGAWTDRHPPFP